jgi:hypothetical protein
MPLATPYAPVPVDKIRMAFPASVMADLMPTENEIPEEFWHDAPGVWVTAPKGWSGRIVDGQCYWTDGWVAIATSWFINGLPAEVKFHMKDGVDGQTAFDHLQCILGSYEPSHQHKEAAVAFLLSEWCERVENWRHL